MATVLVAEDDPDIRALVVFKIKHSGHDVVAVADGRAACEAALAAPPDLVLLDVMMPEMSGLEVCRALRADPRTAHLPIIMLTAKSRQRDVEEGLAAGADDYIVKPFSPRDLITRIEAQLTRAAQSPTGRGAAG